MHKEIQLVPSQLKESAEQTEEHTKGGKYLLLLVSKDSIMDEGKHSFSNITSIGTTKEVKIKGADRAFSLKHKGAGTQNSGTQGPKQGTKEGLGTHSRKQIRSKSDHDLSILKSRH